MKSTIAFAGGKFESSWLVHNFGDMVFSSSTRSSVVIVSLLGLTVVCSAAWWPFSEGEEDDVQTATSRGEDATEPAKDVVPFEMKAAEQKFLVEAQQFLDLSPLDHCQNQVIAKLRKSCGEVTEEELGKLSVELLNCQSQTERRQTFPCTEDMSLAECTSGMDAHMWNAYHIVSNRARSVCYATRQQQFRRQTEVAVNRLSQSTLEQLAAMQELASSHSEIREVAHESLQTLQEHQAQLMEKQREVIGAHEGMRERLASNLQQLEEEKKIIHHGQEQLANMTRGVHNQLESASDLLNRQEEDRRKSHQEILKDITSIRENIREVWERVDGSTNELLQVMGEIGGQYKATLDNLRLINSTVSSLLSLVVGMDLTVTSQLQWLAGQLGGAQDGLRVLTACATHACFLLIATLCVLFVRAPAPSRVALLVLVVGNVVAEVKFRVALSIYALCALETAILIGNWLFFCLPSNARAQRYHVAPSSVPPPLQNSSFSSDESDHELSKDHSITSPVTCDKWNSSVLREAETVSSTPLKLPFTPLHSSFLPPLTHASTPRSSRQCAAYTRSGLQCRLPATPGRLNCHRHSKAD